ncbi:MULTISPECIES: type II toxin-antitoxin system prevent-host-death family antitoxin [unclassified Acinetobacter]|uniref:type II toxin-antitoxin system Phd/YefM family antitoxin n=1 Tax=unclassified Acinetobacter TaxID=196816 RepID=UPI0018AB936B|nr:MULTISPECIES: type II toxin-antitoxin system prevent-host-death family antitoxin [unclassified Acinetobacter]MBJ9952240.1 type II toxin-antitoxin system Phd/YefM family antitoxin [Acinetobacter baumannii]
METMNHTNARAQLSILMNKAILGQPVEVTHKDKESVVIISKSSFESYKRAKFDQNLTK